MALKRVTITGADNNTVVADMLDISRKYPFVEWGILVSKNSEGTTRFPNRDWMHDLYICAQNNINLSMHICGTWTRQLMAGVLNFSELPALFHRCQRVQINTHAERLCSTSKMFEQLSSDKEHEFIFQIDGINDHLHWAAKNRGLNCSGLFDLSHGAGILPSKWPIAPSIDNWAGYAGGIGPENVERELRKILFASKTDVWIDMETRVRTDDDKCLDLDKVTAVLNICAPFCNDHSYTPAM